MKWTFIICWVFITNNVLAQSQGDTIHSEHPKQLFQDLRLSITGSSWLNNFPGPQLGIEKAFRNRKFLELEAAYFFRLRNFDYISEGYRIKLGYKYPLKYPEFMFFKLAPLNPSIRKEFHFLINLFFRQVWFERSQTFTRHEGLYFQDIRFTQLKTLIGPAIGFVRMIERNKIHYEYGTSIGMGRYYVTNYDLPEDAMPSDNQRFYDSEGSYQYIILSVQLKVKFQL